ncbi:MAG TPA: hypothetical protein VKU19_19675 [Bryobacteraceae bacterium]|nr:hypothetical protein [Bryobacteraceae bacterium]
MKRLKSYGISLAMLMGAALLTAVFAQQATPPPAPQKSTPPKTAPAQKTPVKQAGPAAMTNQDVIKLVKAQLPEDLIISKIKSSQTRFDTSVDGLVALKSAGVTDPIIAVMMNPKGSASSGPPPESSTASSTATKAPPAKPAFPPSNVSKEVVANETNTVRRNPVPVVTAAPENYGVYIWADGGLKPLGRVQTKVQISKFRSLLKSMVPFVRQKIDIDIPGAHSTSRYELLRPTFFAFFPPSRDVSKFKLLQCKITGQRFDQRTLANASILFSTEQNQDEVPCDIGPTPVKDLYRISPREDIPSGEFGFVEGNTGSKSTSNIEILDVYDFALDRKEDKMGLKDYLQTVAPAGGGDRSFMEWTREDCQRIVADRTGKVGLTGSLMGFFDRQYGSLDVYWADNQFAHAFARLEMLDKDLTPDQTAKLAGLLVSNDSSQFYIMVSIGGKVGSGKLIGANEGERLMRPFDASLADEKAKDIVPAKHLDFIGGYAGLWKVTFDQKSIRGPLLQSGQQRIQFEARLNQNLEFSAKFQVDRLNTLTSTPGGQ